uniref:DNA-binding protein Ets97D n=1 Tax=Daphnia galeata TaxID=27404 RepID=A0A8J2WFN1_9CRUS|nr:unnamed protein product [Daphnia galeata]
MDDVFLSEVDLEGHEEWNVVGGSTVGTVSYMPTNSENEMDILAVQLDITSPLSTLKAILGHRLGADFSHCELWLQDLVQLTDETTLSEQCIQGEGLVQVNLELKSIHGIDRINIIDVLKTQQDEEMNLNEHEIMEGLKNTEMISLPDPVLEEVSNVALQTVTYQDNTLKTSELPTTPGTIVQHTVANPLAAAPIKTSNANKISCKMPTPQNENITRWVMDGNFRKEQERLKIPLDPILWSKAHIQYWIRWAINQFNLKGVNPSQWAFVDGPSLCNMTHTEFIQRIPKNPSSKDPNHDLFWTHLELLRKCKFVGVIQKPVPYLQYITTPLTVKSDTSSRMPRPPVRVVTPAKRIPLETFSSRSLSIANSGNRTGSNGQVQLWQFLLELLTDVNFRDAISWLGTGGEFKLNNPETVAQLWGERKNKPHMNYEKLSRALRYYYDGDMICKVSGKRFVYKFVCDLKQLLGYSADELNKLVTECEQRSKLRRASSSYV